MDVVLYGFGRIGRLMAEFSLRKQMAATACGSAPWLCAVERPRMTFSSAPVSLEEIRCMGFSGTIRVDEERQSFVANGNEVKVIYADAPRISTTRNMASKTAWWWITPASGGTKRVCHVT
ncbi:MAG: hypothetical protein CM15mP84_03820 [Cellvibrionales bacterium]|nr:MAG: hypothetical protein CM15mP84_03820 [Cellvibrionales bacterium]